MAIINNMKNICFFCGRQMEQYEKRCPYCGNLSPYPDVDDRGRRGKWEEDKEHCYRCQKGYKSSDDKFCRYCGSIRDNRLAKYFKVSPEYMECVYGPMPVKVEYICLKCSYKWTGTNWDKELFCPQCGFPISGEYPPQVFRMR